MLYSRKLAPIFRHKTRLALGSVFAITLILFALSTQRNRGFIEPDEFVQETFDGDEFQILDVAGPIQQMSEDPFMSDLLNSLQRTRQVFTLKRVRLSSVPSFLLFLHLPESDVISRSIVASDKGIDKLALIIADLMRQKEAKGKLFIDVGANIGTISIAVAKAGFDVISFEASSINFECVQNSRNINKLGNAIINHNAVSDENGVKLCMRSQASKNLGVMMANKVKGTCSDEVESITLDTYFADLKQGIHVLKIDVEGFEAKVVRGANKILTDPKLRPKYVAMEFVPRFISKSGEDPLQLLYKWMDLGYSVAVLETKVEINRENAASFTNSPLLDLFMTLKD